MKPELKRHFKNWLKRSKYEDCFSDPRFEDDGRGFIKVFDSKKIDLLIADTGVKGCKYGDVILCKRGDVIPLSNREKVGNIFDADERIKKQEEAAKNLLEFIKCYNGKNVVFNTIYGKIECKIRIYDDGLEIGDFYDDLEIEVVRILGVNKKLSDLICNEVISGVYAVENECYDSKEFKKIKSEFNKILKEVEAAFLGERDDYYYQFFKNIEKRIK